MQAGNVGALLAPGVAVLAVTVRLQFVPWIPLAATGFVAAAAAVALPETLGMPHADTFQVCKHEEYLHGHADKLLHMHICML